MRQLKLIWDFKGPDGQHTAQHHAVHLQEFCEARGHTSVLIGHEAVNEMHSIAYMVVPEDQMKLFRDALRPHRGQVYSE